MTKTETSVQGKESQEGWSGSRSHPQAFLVQHPEAHRPSFEMVFESA
jgi:hypothetical protein